MARKWWTLTAVVAGMFMLPLDVTIVNVALPQIQKAFGASLPDTPLATRAGFTGSLNTILLIGAAIAAAAAITSLTLIRGRDFAAEPAAPGRDTDADCGQLTVAAPVTS